MLLGRKTTNKQTNTLSKASTIIAFMPSLNHLSIPLLSVCDLTLLLSPRVISGANQMSVYRLCGRYVWKKLCWWMQLQQPSGGLWPARRQLSNLWLCLWLCWCELCKSSRNGYVASLPFHLWNLMLCKLLFMWWRHRVKVKIHLSVCVAYA